MPQSRWRNRGYICRLCVAEEDRRSQENPEWRAKKMVRGARWRAKKKGLECSLDWRDIARVLEGGYCEVTGLPFNLDPIDDVRNHPRAPSLDRLDSAYGYIPSNVKVVIWQHNMAKGEWSEELLAEYCTALLERN